jgi:hypothetical protein
VQEAIAEIKKEPGLWEELKQIEKTTGDFRDTVAERKEWRRLIKLHPECQLHEMTQLHVAIRKYRRAQPGHGRPIGVTRPVAPRVSWAYGSVAAGTQSRRGLPVAPIEYSSMTKQPGQMTLSQRRPQARKFYIISYSFAHKLADFEVENQAVLRGSALALYPPAGTRGFPVYPEKPRVVIGKRKSGPLPSDIELYHSYWLVSDRLKSLFEAVDPPAFAFQACDVELRDESPGPVYWLCDVIRVLDTFGEKTKDDIRRYQEKTGLKCRGILGDKTLVFNEAAIGESHIFRTPYSQDNVFCDQHMKDVCKKAGIKGIQFQNCFP